MSNICPPHYKTTEQHENPSDAHLPRMDDAGSASAPIRTQAERASDPAATGPDTYLAAVLWTSGC